MGKDTRLVNIYLKIHNKKMLTMDDLAYLAEYDPECFAKTCKNVVYNIPEAKPIMESPDKKSPCPEPEQNPPIQQSIEEILERLRRLEMNAFPNINVDDEVVKNLLGNLYMEMLFPHNDKATFMNMADGNTSTFDRKA
ncbi:MAG: hypothetical protein NC251_08900 [Lachnoclostridium sp.]|nr:hypothetical protein [Lachnospira sp.]MCM1248534.1 hypothetical protein [Lachnoclostridium sp.]MCM1536037.1 hypothetical protein [Clostridium sp.]